MFFFYKNLTIKKEPVFAPTGSVKFNSFLDTSSCLALHARVKLIILLTLGNKLVVGSLLDYPSLFQNDNTIAISYS